MLTLKLQRLLETVQIALHLHLRVKLESRPYSGKLEKNVIIEYVDLNTDHSWAKFILFVNITSHSPVFHWIRSQCLISSPLIHFRSVNLPVNLLPMSPYARMLIAYSQ